MARWGQVARWLGRQVDREAGRWIDGQMGGREVAEWVSDGGSQQTSSTKAVEMDCCMKKPFATCQH